MKPAGPTFLDLFAGAGGLSEGFIRAGFIPVAHVETDRAACNTLRTRMAFHHLKAKGNSEIYLSYLAGKLRRENFYDSVPREITDSIIEAEIGQDTLPDIFRKVDGMLGSRRLDLIVGGPPCQAYSLVGRARDGQNMRGDTRNYLYQYYAEFLKRYQPRHFIFENVVGLKTAKDTDGELHLDKMKCLFKECGYSVEVKTLEAQDFGVLQNRRRVFISGKLGENSGFFPMPERWSPEVSVWDLFNGLRSLNAGEGKSGLTKLRKVKDSYLHDSKIVNGFGHTTWHQARPHSRQDMEIYRRAVELWNNGKERLNYNDLPERLKTHKNRKSFVDRFKVVAGDRLYSHTVVAHIAKDGHYYIHPDINQNRSLTPREVARLQTFPDDFYFEGVKEGGSRTAAFRQIGNAVPVLLAEKIAEVLIREF